MTLLGQTTRHGMRWNICRFKLIPLLLLVALVVSACFPFPATSTFYKPTATAGTAKSGSYGGPPDNFFLARQGVTFGLRISTRYPQEAKESGYLGARAIIRIPSHTTLHFSLANLRVFDSSDKVIGPHDVTIHKSEILSATNENSSVELEPPIKFVSSSHVSFYYVLFRIKVVSSNIYPDSLYVILPKMEINGKYYPAVQIQFTKITSTNWGWFGP